MVLATLKHVGKWNWMEHMFKMRGPTFERIITSFISTTCKHLYDAFVVHCRGSVPMHVMEPKGFLFRQYSCALYGTDVKFWLSFRPFESVEEGYLYYSGKHKAYGYKVEVFVLQNGVAIWCSSHRLGSILDLGLMREMQDFLKTQSVKMASDSAVPDSGPLRTGNSVSCALLADRACISSKNLLRVIHLRRKLAGGMLHSEDEQQDSKISSDRITDENYFARLCAIEHPQQSRIYCSIYQTNAQISFVRLIFEIDTRLI